MKKMTSTFISLIIFIGTFSFATELLTLDSNNFNGISGIRNFNPERMIDDTVEGDDNAGISAFNDQGDTFNYVFEEEMLIDRIRLGRREGQPTSKWYVKFLDAQGNQTHFVDILDNNPRLSNLIIMDETFSPVVAQTLIFGHEQVTSSNDRATWSELELFGVVNSEAVPELSSAMMIFCAFCGWGLWQRQKSKLFFARS